MVEAAAKKRESEERQQRAARISREASLALGKAKSAADAKRLAVLKGAKARKKKGAALGCARHVSPCGWETWSA